MALLLILFSVPLAILPSLLYLGVVWWLDRYEREPLWLVVLVFGWGAVGGVLLGESRIIARRPALTCSAAPSPIF